MANQDEQVNSDQFWIGAADPIPPWISGNARLREGVPERALYKLKLGPATRVYRGHLYENTDPGLELILYKTEEAARAACDAVNAERGDAFYPQRLEFKP